VLSLGVSVAENLGDNREPSEGRMFSGTGKNWCFGASALEMNAS
jgi:hypothetical protein